MKFKSNRGELVASTLDTPIQLLSLFRNKSHFCGEDSSSVMSAVPERERERDINRERARETEIEKER